MPDDAPNSFPSPSGRASKRIVLISSGQPSVNPRLVKEADALADAGHNVLVLYAYWNAWATELDNRSIPGKKWLAIRVGGDPVVDKVAFFASRLVHKLARWICKFFPIPYLAGIAVSRAGHALAGIAKKHPADLYIAHNLGALPAAVKAARRHNARCGFDAEDLHRFETNELPTGKAARCKILVEDLYIPQVHHFTASSPLIAAAYQEIYPAIAPVTILNVFPADTRVSRYEGDGRRSIRLFWFSQTIGPGRGLEEVAVALELLKHHPFELHLLGQNGACPFFDGSPNVFFHPPIPPEDIPVFASRFDIGLATEQRTPLNRDLCLTNKIFTYIGAGLAVVASDTAAQSALLGRHPGIGRTYPCGSAQGLAGALLAYYQDERSLIQARGSSYDLGRDLYNWELEQQKFLAAIERSW